MKIIQLYAIVTIIVCLIYIAFSLKANKASDNSKGEILPRDQWYETLIGKWQVEFQIEDPTYILDVVGNTEFRSDSTYVDLYEFKYFAAMSVSAYFVKKENDFLKKIGKAYKYGEFNVWQFSGFQDYSIDKYLDVCEQEFSYDNGKEVDICGMIITNCVAHLGDLEWIGNVYKILVFEKEFIKHEVRLMDVEKPIIVTYKKIE